MQPFKWMEAHQVSFNAPKHALITAPVLSYPDFPKEYVLETDTSLKGLGSVLSLVGDDGKSHVLYMTCLTSRFVTILEGQIELLMP